MPRSASRRRAARAAALSALVLAVAGGASLVQANPDDSFAVEAVAKAAIPGGVEIASRGASDAGIVRITIAPGGDGGWHSHSGPVLVTVTRGTATFYDGDDPDCTPRRVGQGQGLVEHPGHVHLTTNEGSEPLELYAVSVVPAGADVNLPAEDPGSCPL
jgi:quercetin dioxygenase-like cupin family protein